MRRTKPKHIRPGHVMGWVLIALCIGLSAHADEQTLNKVTAISVKEGAQTTQITVKGSTAPTFSVTRLMENGPPRLFVDLSNAEFQNVPSPIEVENGVISMITIQQRTDQLVRIGRIIVALELDAPHTVNVVGNDLVIAVDASQRKTSVAGSPSDAAALAAARARAEAAEARAKDAEERAKKSVKAADARVAAAEAKARASEAKALRAAEQARREAQASNQRATDAQKRADELVAQATAARQKAQSTSSAQRQELEKRAQDAERRAKAAEALATAARQEAKASQAAATARAEAANARAKEAEARVQAAQARETQSQQAATVSSQKANDLASQAKQAQDKAQVATRALEAAQAKLAAVKSRAEDAERRASQAENRAETAESRAKTAESKAQKAEENQRLAEIRARKIEKAARVAAENANRAAQAAEKRAAQAEGVSKKLTDASAKARADAKRLEKQLADSKSSNVDRAQLQRQLQQAQSRADSAQDRADGARREAEAAKQAAIARLASAEARAKAAEAQTKAAEARAAAAEAKTKQAEQLAEARALKAQNLAQSAEAADKRVATTQSALERANRQLASTIELNRRLEENVQKAEKQVRQAEARAANARGEVNRSNANIELANSKLAAAETRERAAQERTAAANRRAQEAEQAAANARSSAQRLRANATTETNQRQARLAEADARAAAAEARAQRLEADRAQLAQQNEKLKSEKARSAATMAQLKANQSQLDGALAAARAANDKSQQRLVEAQQRAQKAQVAVQTARTAQIESAQAVARLKGQVKTLELEVVEAEKNSKTAEVSRLNASLASARQRIGSLTASLDSNQQALTKAQANAEEKRKEIERLNATMRKPSAAAVAPTPVVATPTPTPAVKTPVPTPVVTTPVPTPVVTTPVPPAPKVVAPKTTTPAVAQTATKAAKDKVIRPVLPPPPPQIRTRITDVRFSETQSHSEIKIAFEGPPARYVVKKEGSRTLILEIERALIDPAIERSLDTSEFQGAVQLVSSFQAPPPGDRVRVVATLNQIVKAQISPGKNELTWRFRLPARTPMMAGGLPPASRWSGRAPSELRTDTPKAAVYTGMGQAIMTRRASKKRPVRRKRYTGRKINIDIKDGDIHNILRLLAKEGNVNIVTSDEVKGSVTMHLKLVPWDQALEIILRTKGLDMVRDGDIIRVAPISMLAKEREAELKKQEVKEKLKPLEVKLVTVNHANASQLMPRVKSVLSKRGTSEFDARTNTVILKDVDDHLDAAEDIIRRLDTQTPQVLIETRIVEVNEVNVNQLGIQWGMDSTYSAATGNPTGLRFPSSIGISGGADDLQGSTEGVSSNPNFVVNLPSSAGLGSGGALGLTFGSIDSTFNLNIRLSALENRGSVKIVSSPKITTLDNKQARISQGVSIPISQVSAAGIQTVFFDAVLSLIATPHVTQDGNIYLKLRAENNTPDFQNVGARGDPTILKKEAQTELLLKDGDTTVIGGIYTSNAGFNRSEVPYLARIPILGAFFRNHQESDRRSELLIFVTPRIVNRAASTVRTVP